METGTATTIFGVELDRRLRVTGSPIVSALAHPGLTRTNLAPRAWEHRGRVGQLIAGLGLLATPSVEQGALPQLRAATAARLSTPASKMNLIAAASRSSLIYPPSSPPSLALPSPQPAS